MSKIKSQQSSIKKTQNDPEPIEGSKVKIDIEHVAKLASLTLAKDEKNIFSPQLEKIVGYISQLEELDTKKVEPIGHITEMVNVTRSDDNAPSLNQEEALANAPKTHNGFFEVEAIFDND